MIKKHLVTCSVICVLVFISCLSAFGRADKKKPKRNTADYQFIYPKNHADLNFNFAAEDMPLNDKRISRKLRTTLVHSSFNNVQSNILQEEAARLFPIIEPILKANGIPDDFKYVPLVEAGLKSGVSRRGAAGWWQFMPGSARNYGLKVGNGRDERYNIRKSTVAACKYFKELYGEFHSWTLVAAGYNFGEIKLAKAMREQSQRNYFRMHLNQETGSYVYHLIAMKEIIERPQLYGYKKYDNGPVFNASVQPSDLVAIN